MKNAIKMIPALLISALFLVMHLSCSPISPTAGTETGNPGVVTSALLAFSRLTDNRWNPESHLEGGVRQLDPEYAIGPQPPVHLAKRKTTGNDTSTTGVEINIITYYDTIITIDTLLVNDTVVQAYSKKDTITLGSSDIVFDSLIVDSIYVIDTVLQYDTTVTQHYDTVWVPVRNDTSPPNPGVITKGRLSYVTHSYGTFESSFPLSGGTESVYAIDGRRGQVLLTLDDYNSSNTKNLQSISRYDSSGGIKSVEQYKDGNGDNLLYFSIGNMVPQIKLTGRYWDDVYEKIVEVHFDAGVDNTFNTTDDNRIYSLVKKKIMGGTVLSKVTYRETSRDSVLLTISESAPTDSIAKNDVIYIGMHGDDSFDHRDNTLKEIQQNVRYRSGTIEKIKLTVQFGGPVGVTEMPDSASVSSIIWFADGRVEVLNGRIKGDILEGTFWKDGIKYSVTCKYINGTIELLSVTKNGDEH